MLIIVEMMNEIMIQVQRTFPGETNIKRGDKIAQGVFVMVQTYFEWTEVSKMQNTSRGGFGSTDEK